MFGSEEERVYLALKKKADVPGRLWAVVQKESRGNSEQRGKIWVWERTIGKSELFKNAPFQDLDQKKSRGGRRKEASET